jgi:hypothetical protein
MQKQSTLYNLFLIIQAMTREEKRYFKLYIKGLGKIEGNQSKLFDFLSKQELFEDSFIKKKVKSIFPSQNKSALQINTYQNIIKSLNLFHANTYAETKILNLLKTIKLLYVKNLYRLVLPEIEKAKKLAIDHKYVALLPQILFWEFRVKGEIFSFNNTSEEAMKNKYEEFEQAILELQNVFAYTKSWTSFYVYVRRHFSNKSDTKNNTTPNCIKNLPHPIHLHSALLNRRIKTLQASLEKDYNSGIDHMMISLYEIEKSPQVIKEYFHDFVSCIHRIIENAIIIKKWNIAREYLEKFKNTSKTLWAPTTTAIYYDLVFYYNFSFGSIRANTQVCLEAQKLLKSHQQQLQLPIIQNLVLAIAVSAFYQNDYDQCIDYLTQIETLKNQDPVIKNTVKILLMLTYYEKNENRLLPYVIRSNYRFFKKNEPQYNIGYNITQSLSKVAKSISKEKTNTIWINLQQDLSEQDRSYDDNSTLFFNVQAWLNSQIKGIDIEESLVEYRDQ